MRSTIKQAFAVAILLIGFASVAYAGRGHANNPCQAQHQTVQTACASDRHSSDCKAAHKAMKACRVANGLSINKGRGTASVNKGLSTGTETTTPAPAPLNN